MALDSGRVHKNSTWRCGDARITNSGESMKNIFETDLMQLKSANIILFPWQC